MKWTLLSLLPSKRDNTSTTSSPPTNFRYPGLLSIVTLKKDAQRAASGYSEKLMLQQVDHFYLAGHSKGGNLALYAACQHAADQQDRILAIYPFDVPGLHKKLGSILIYSLYIYSKDYYRLTPYYQMTRSMFIDNAPIESFFGYL